MKVKKALDFRQQFGSILDEMKEGGEPIVIEKNSAPVAVLISYQLFQQRFIDYQNAKSRITLLENFKNALKPAKTSSLAVLKELRYGR